MAEKTKKTGALKPGVRIKIKEPSFYKVVMLNDDVTPMDFVVDILVEVFDREHAAAVELMLKVHHEGSAVVGSYPYDVARTKQRYCIERARSKGYPFELRLDRE